MSDPPQQYRVPSDQDDPLKVTSVRLPYWHIRQAKKIGNGNFSDGIRLAIEATALPPPEPKEKP